jgi:ribosomal protein S18 acetylase RimI-like enzyme
MGSVQYRVARNSDIPAMARIRAAEWETEEYWTNRVSLYLNCEEDPQKVLKPRVAYVAKYDQTLVGFIAGHLTRRHACDGELEWITVIPEYRGSPVAPGLLRLLAAWFVEQKAMRVCVDVDPANMRARRFYKRHGSVNLHKHWLVRNDINAVLAQRRARRHRLHRPALSPNSSQPI